jgi:hypothetical protein
LSSFFPSTRIQEQASQYHDTSRSQKLIHLDTNTAGPSNNALVASTIINNNMDYRQSTPPQAEVHVEDYDFQRTGGSASTASTFYPHDWSPASAMTAASTPPRSPLKPRESGPLLLPRVRAQDQYMGMGHDSACLDHKRTVSLTRNDFPMQFGGHLPTPNGSERCSQSPASFSLVALPSAPVSQAAAPFDLASSQRSSMAHMMCRRSIDTAILPTGTVQRHSLWAWEHQCLEHQVQ